MPIGYREGQHTRSKKDGTGHTLVTRDTIARVTGDDQTKTLIAKNNTKQVQEAIDDALVAALTEIGISCERFAKTACPVDTGRLRNSITWQLSTAEKSVYVGTNVEYAFSVHEGTGSNKGKGPRRFLKNAAANHEKYYEEILTKHLKGF